MVMDSDTYYSVVKSKVHNYEELPLRKLNQTGEKFNTQKRVRKIDEKNCVKTEHIISLNSEDKFKPFWMIHMVSLFCHIHVFVSYKLLKIPCLDSRYWALFLLRDKRENPTYLTVGLHRIYLHGDKCNLPSHVVNICMSIGENVSPKGSCFILFYFFRGRN